MTAKRMHAAARHAVVAAFGRAHGAIAEVLEARLVHADGILVVVDDEDERTVAVRARSSLDRRLRLALRGIRKFADELGWGDMNTTTARGEPRMNNGNKGVSTPRRCAPNRYAWRIRTMRISELPSARSLAMVEREASSVHDPARTALFR